MPNYTANLFSYIKSHFDTDVCDKIFNKATGLQRISSDFDVLRLAIKAHKNGHIQQANLLIDKYCKALLKLQFKPKCSDFGIYSHNGDSKCYRSSVINSKLLIIRNPDLCNNCIYNKF